MSRRTFTTAATAALVATLAATSLSEAAKPPKSTNVSLRADPGAVRFGASVVLSGKVAGNPSGMTIKLEQAPYPYAAFVATPAQTTTDGQGNFRLSVAPQKHTRYRVVAMASPPATSDPVEVRTSLAVSRTVSDSTPRRGQRVRFSGTVRPAHDGAAVQLQRRGADGVFRTVARTRTVHATTAQSAYRVSVVVRKSAVFRVRVTGDADHDAGLSATRTLRVH